MVTATGFVPRYNFVFNLFLEEILESVETVSLYECRRVNKFWKNVTDPILLQRKDHLVSFSYSSTLNTFVSSIYYPNKKASVGQDGADEKGSEVEGKDLATFLQKFAEPSRLNGTLPPTRNFKFTGPIFNNNVSFNQFISKCSPFIQELTLDWDEKGAKFENRVSEIPGFLRSAYQAEEVLWLSVLANGSLNRLERLIVNNFRFFNFFGDQIMDATFRDFEHLKLKHPAQILAALKFVEIKMSQKFWLLFDGLDNLLPDLIAAAPNLQQVYYSKYFSGLKARQILVERPALFRVECLHFALFNEDEGYFGEERPHKILEYTEKYCSQNKGLVYLDLHSWDPPAQPAIFQNTVLSLMKLVSRSASSLKYVRFGNAALILFMRIAQACGVVTFPRVKTFLFGHGPTRDPRVILNKYPDLFHQLLKESYESSLSNNLSDLFPNLEAVTFSDVRSSVFETFFPFPKNPHQILTKVKSIKVLVAEEARIICRLLKLVPFVRKVNLRNMRDFPKISGLLWQLEHAETLELHLWLAMVKHGVQTPAHFFPCIDSAFTGIPEEILQIGKCVDVKLLPRSALDELRRNRRSILNLHQLKHLTLDFHYTGSNEDFEKHFSGFLTDTSFKFGWSMMENLSVTLKSSSAVLDRVLCLFSSFEKVSIKLSS